MINIFTTKAKKKKSIYWSASLKLEMRYTNMQVIYSFCGDKKSNICVIGEYKF